MLQQTQVSRVLDRFPVFLERFPAARSCAEAPVADVITLWAGMGYNRRAVNLWRAASVVVDQHGGQIPSTLPELLNLPGVGPYTARAVLAFAFERDVGVVDTNVGRLLARWSGVRLRPSAAQQLADELVPPTQGWRWNQSLFDFAVAVCTKREPACGGCPVRDACSWRGQGDDPALGSAGVSSHQAAFSGSDREVRGRIVEALRQGPVRWSELQGLGRPTDDPQSVEAIARGLIRDGLAQPTSDGVSLPGR